MEEKVYGRSAERAPIVAKHKVAQPKAVIPVFPGTNCEYDTAAACLRAGIPAIGYGPGDDSLCHSTQDKVPVDELMDAICFYASLPIMVPKKD